jgi:hypothetical protein
MFVDDSVEHGDSHISPQIADDLRAAISNQRNVFGKRSV